MNLSNEFHIAFYAATITICMTVLLFTFLQKRTDRPQNKLFVVMIIILTMNAISSTGAALTQPKAAYNSSAYILLEIFQFLYFFLHTALCPIFYYYVLCVTGVIRKRSMFRNIITGIPLLITEGFVIVNPFFHCVYYYDSYFSFSRNWAEALIYGAAGLYYVLSLSELLFSWNAITKRRSVAIVYFFILSLGGILIQLFDINIKSELFAESIALMGIMLAVESEDDRLDSDTNIYNRKALQMDVHNSIALNDDMRLLFIKIANSEVVERLTGSANNDVMTTAISKYLTSLVPRYNLYHPNSDTFVMTFIGCEDEEVNDIVDRVSNRFKDKWDILNVELILKAAIIDTSLPGELNTIADVLFVADKLIPANANPEDIDIAWIMRRAEVERAVKRNLREEKFEVYYQPTYNLVGPSLHGAEALVRMIDDSIGFISPEEFIPVAEQMGLVEEIDDFVLNEVCKFIKSGIPSSKGMDCINVNLSVVQCLSPGFFEHTVRIVDKYEVDHAMINFEITESVGADDYQVLSEIAKNLKTSGFKLSMDDYGTGYSNMESIFALDFDVVKIDKSILWSAEKNANGRTILKNSINMIHDLGAAVLVEGVEKQEHIDVLTSLGVDYLQGYFFSKPVPKSTLLEII